MQIFYAGLWRADFEIFLDIPTLSLFSKILIWALILDIKLLTSFGLTKAESSLAK